MTVKVNYEMSGYVVVNCVSPMTPLVWDDNLEAFKFVSGQCTVFDDKHVAVKLIEDHGHSDLEVCTVENGGYNYPP